MSAAFLQIARQWGRWGLYGALLWVTAQLPVPVLHAHGSHPAAAHELPLGQHVERCHGGELVADFIDWHLHWFSPRTVLKELGETQGDAEEESLSQGACPTVGSQEWIWNELLAWGGSLSAAWSETGTLGSRNVAPGHVSTRAGGAALAWYGSPRNRLCRLQLWRC